MNNSKEENQNFKGKPSVGIISLIVILSMVIVVLLAILLFSPKDNKEIMVKEKEDKLAAYNSSQNNISEINENNSIYYIGNTTNNTENVVNKNDNENNEIRKIDSKKEIVYDAEYTYKNLEDMSYTSKSMNKTYSMKDIVLPYINLNSSDVNKANTEIQALFKELAEFFEEELEGTQTWYKISSYDYFINKDILSIIITTESGGTDVPVYKYYTYNFNLKTLNLIKYEDVYSIIGINQENIEKKVETAIKSQEQLKPFANEIYMNDLNGKVTYAQKSIDNYIESVKENNIQYFFNKDGNLNIIVSIEIPVGKGYFDTIIEI